MKTLGIGSFALVVTSFFATLLFADEEIKLTPQQVRDASRVVLTREATAESPDERAAAISDLCKLYVAVCRDTDMALDARKTLRAKLYTRLIRIKQDLEADLSRRKRDADAETPTYPIVESAAAYSQSTVDPAPRGGGTVRDYGEALVELIQATISPKHWDVNGGPGSIVYWPTLHVLVVRASGDTHGHVGGLFDGLRACRKRIAKAESMWVECPRGVESRGMLSRCRNSYAE